VFDRISDVFIATSEGGKGWSYEVVEVGRDDDQDEDGEFVIEYGDGFRSREAARQAGEHLMGEYMASLDADTRARIKSNRQG